MHIIKHFKGMWYNHRGHSWERKASRKLHGRLFKNPNHPRTDMTVDGVEVQIKRGSWSNIREHIHKYKKHSGVVVWIPNRPKGKPMGILTSILLSLKGGK